MATLSDSSVFRPTYVNEFANASYQTGLENISAKFCQVGDAGSTENSPAISTLLRNAMDISQYRGSSR